MAQDDSVNCGLRVVSPYGRRQFLRTASCDLRTGVGAAARTTIAAMTWLLPFMALALGAVVGSFLNVVIYRYPRGESVVFPASHCPHCNTDIRPYDNVPVLA